MMKEIRVKARDVRSEMRERWASLLQRRVMRLLLLLDPQLFRGQFCELYQGSSLASHPLLRFYDQHIKLLMLSQELLDDILPRIHLQWSQQTEHTFIQEENPARGQIDWQKTIEQANNEVPGQLPLRFAVRQLQQRSQLPENLLVVAILLRHRQVVHEILRVDQQEELLTGQERQVLVTLEERLEHELIVPQVRALIETAQTYDLDTLIGQARSQLHPGPSPYRDVLDWWEHFSTIHIGDAVASPRLSLAHKQRYNEQMDHWLYELWIALELTALFQEQNALLPDTLTLLMDQLSFAFRWNDKHYRFHYQHRGASGITDDRQGMPVPAFHASFLIEREPPLKVEYQGKRIWQEPPVIVDVAYTPDTEESMQRLLGCMAGYAATAGVLISPHLAEPHTRIHMNGEVYDTPEWSSNRWQAIAIEQHTITPDMPQELLQTSLLTMLQHIIAHLPERPQPTCCGVMLDQDSSNESGRIMQEYDVLCPKPHIGSTVYDLVSRERHCLKDPRLCHVIGQVAMPPQIKRVMNHDDLKRNMEQLRAYGEAAVRQAEDEKDEEKAEHFRTLVLQQMGEMIEHYVQMRGDTVSQEKFLREGIFKEYWTEHAYQLEQETRHILISGEYVWDEYQHTQLNDWGASAVQYCRALEREIKRRFYTPVKTEYLIDEKKWTLGSIKSMYNEGKPGTGNKNWQTFTARARKFHITQDVLIQQFVEPMVIKEYVSDLRNNLAHGQPVDRETARRLRKAILGVDRPDGLLTWLVRNVGT